MEKLSLEALLAKAETDKGARELAADLAEKISALADALHGDEKTAGAVYAAALRYLSRTE